MCGGCWEEAGDPPSHADSAPSHTSPTLSPALTSCAYVLPAYWSARMLYDMILTSGESVGGNGPPGALAAPTHRSAQISTGAASVGGSVQARKCGVK